MPFFSVIITTYNSEKYIRRTIKCLQRQSYKNFEIIFIDDASSDQTIKIIKSFKLINSNIEVLKKNFGGPSKGRNLGLKKAKGKWIVFLDADDFWKKDILQIVFNNIKINKHFEVFSTREICVNKNDSTKKNIKFFDYKNEYFYNFLIYGNQLSPSSSFLSLKFLKKNKLEFSELKKFISVEDYDFWLKLARLNARFFYIKKYLCYYILNKKNLSLKKKHKKNFCNLLKYYINFLPTSISMQISNRLKFLKIMDSNNTKRKFFFIINFFFKNPFQFLRNLQIKIQCF